MYCSACTKNEIPCINPQKVGDYCGVHCKHKYDECSICYKPMHKKVTLTCNHTLCKSCVIKWFSTSNTCPLCRKVDISMHVPIKDLKLQFEFDCKIHVNAINKSHDQVTRRSNLCKMIDFILMNEEILHYYDNISLEEFFDSCYYKLYKFEHIENVDFSKYYKSLDVLYQRFKDRLKV